MVVSILPAVAGVQTQNTLNENAKINLNENAKQLEVNAASKYSKKVKKIKRSSKYRYKKVKTYKYKKYRYKKVKAAYKYKKTIYKKAVSTSVGAKNVVVTSKYVMATGRHSCAMKSNYSYHTRVFKNYNPKTKTNGTLKFEQGVYYGPNKGTSPEGLWYDVKTDMDFCLVHGMSHDKRKVHLVPYNGNINGKKVVNGYFV